MSTQRFTSKTYFSSFLFMKERIETGFTWLTPSFKFNIHKKKSIISIFTYVYKNLEVKTLCHVFFKVWRMRNLENVMHVPQNMHVLFVSLVWCIWMKAINNFQQNCRAKQKHFVLIKLTSEETWFTLNSCKWRVYCYRWLTVLNRTSHF